MSDNINIFEGEDKNFYLKTLLYNSRDGLLAGIFLLRFNTN